MARGWMSYLPDGRPIRVSKVADGSWTVECEGREVTGDDLRATIQEAADISHLVTPLQRGTNQLEKWIEQHVPQIEREAAET